MKLGAMLLAAAPLLWMMSVGPARAAPAPVDPAQIAEGKRIAETHCSLCHATGTSGQSPRKEAPLFRNLGQRYALDDLQEALAEGIAVGHPDMPQFEFSPEQGDALIAYLKSIQAPSGKSIQAPAGKPR